MLFSSIPGQTKLADKLKANIRGKKIPHAQLFIGAEGSCALAMAIAYAQYILCQNPGDEACGVCPACKQAENLQHPDMHFAFPVAKTKDSSDKPVSEEFLGQWRSLLQSNPYPLYIEWLSHIGVENKQAQLSVYQANKISSALQLKSYSGGTKILILWMPEKLNTAAANKLLKLIEEPEGQTAILMVTHHEENVLGTIRSRCQAVNVPPVEHSALVQFIENQSNTEIPASIVASLSQGEPGQALHVLKDPQWIKEDVERFTQWVRVSFQRKVAGMVDWSESASGLGRERLKSFLHFALDGFEQALTFNYGAHQTNPFEVSGSDFKFEKFAPFVHAQNILAIQEDINRAIYEIERNLNPKIVLLDLTFQVAKSLNLKP
ncbi:MAG: DNA polymerase III subunit delta' [Flavobacteriia bacterium]|nr:DNA polymerase III subunit delta' [Flavobacteriia bacterium]